MNLDKEYCVITGATSGIGKEFAIYLAKKHYNLILTGRREKELMKLKGELELNYEIEIFLVIGDFVEEGTIKNLLHIAKNKNIKYLINNVGYGGEKTFFIQNIEEVLKMLKVVRMMIL